MQEMTEFAPIIIIMRSRGGGMGVTCSYYHEE